jgi:hypothetical protein
MWHTKSEVLEEARGWRDYTGMETCLLMQFEKIIKKERWGIQFPTVDLNSSAIERDRNILNRKSLKFCIPGHNA